MAITALAGGEFEFPKGSELVSAVYVISISKPLLKPLTINIQHCVALETPEQCNSLQFMRAPLNNGIPPYQFEVLSGGHFTTESQYGSISHTNFSLFGISMEDNTYSEEDSTSDEEDGSPQENENLGNGEEQEGGGEGDRCGEHDESVGEKPQSQTEGNQHQLVGQRVGEEEQEVITTQEGENSINT